MNNNLASRLVFFKKNMILMVAMFDSDYGEENRINDNCSNNKTDDSDDEVTRRMVIASNGNRIIDCKSISGKEGGDG